MKYSLKLSIKRYVEEQYPRWISGLELEKMALSGKFGRVYKGETCGRRARELAHTAYVLEKYPEKKIFCAGCDKGVIEHRENPFVEYRAIRTGKEIPQEEVKSLIAQGILSPEFA